MKLVFKTFVRCFKNTMKNKYFVCLCKLRKSAIRATTALTKNL